MANIPLQKINDLVKAEGFLQVHYLKGYKYIDRAGELVNFFHNEEKEAPQFSMNLNGLTIKSPNDKVAEIKISSTDFWAHFVSPDSLEIMEDFFQSKADVITRILEIEELKRVGWRIYFVQEFSSEEERETLLKKFAPIGGLNFNEVYYTAKISDVSLNVRVRNVMKVEEKENTPGVLIDIDIYNQFEEPVSSAQLLSILNKYKDIVRSDDFLALVNKILS